MQDWQPGWWKYPGHTRKCNEARTFNFEKAVARGRAIFLRQERRRRALELAKNVAAAIAILLTAALVVRLCRP